MCGIIGLLNLVDRAPVEQKLLVQMLAMIRHRGPDGFGIYLGDRVGLGNARLSIIDIRGGDQPIGNEDDTKWIVFNGEIFNYIELRPELEKRGHKFQTHCDTEVIIHLYEEYGPGCLRYLNGQFAIAIWDENEETLFLARDRLGVRPLFYTLQNGQFLFGSEVKSLLVCPSCRTEIDLEALRETFTYWSPQTPASAFKNVYQVPPGHYLLVKSGQVIIEPYWELDFEEETPLRSTNDYLEELGSLLIDASRIRLRADVAVGAYLSGGLDSSITATMIRDFSDSHLDTFSISFSDEQFDESLYQNLMVKYLGTDHHMVYCTHEDIGRIFPQVIWHTETPILRTAPAPMFLLSKLVNDHQYKVVLTGEGADELLAGYDIFKEMKVRRFWARDPESKLRPLLLQKLYPDISGLSSGGAYLMAFFKKDLTNTASPYYSHEIRWSTTSRIQRFLLGSNNAPAEVRRPAIPQQFEKWSPLGKAQYLEITTFLSTYLLSSQGDRMSMAHSVEGRYPFLDYRVVEFCNRLPSHLKLYGLTEKWLLKKMGQRLIPQEIWKRYKRPYRAPIHRSFFTKDRPAYVDELLSEEALRKTGYFEPRAVTKLVQKAAGGTRLSEVEDMALVGILSTQLLHHLFLEGFQRASIENIPDHFKLVDRVIHDQRRVL